MREVQLDELAKKKTEKHWLDWEEWRKAWEAASDSKALESLLHTIFTISVPNESFTRVTVEEQRLSFLLSVADVSSGNENYLRRKAFTMIFNHQLGALRTMFKFRSKEWFWFTRPAEKPESPEERIPLANHDFLEPFDGTGHVKHYAQKQFEQFLLETMADRSLCVRNDVAMRHAALARLYAYSDDEGMQAVLDRIWSRVYFSRTQHSVTDAAVIWSLFDETTLGLLKQLLESNHHSVEGALMRAHPGALLYQAATHIAPIAAKRQRQLELAEEQEKLAKSLGG